MRSVCARCNGRGCDEYLWPCTGCDPAAPGYKPAENVKASGIDDRFDALETQYAKALERIRNLEQGFVTHCDLNHGDTEWCPPENQRDAWRKTFNESVEKIRSIDLAEINRVEAMAPTKEPLDTRKLVHDFLTLPFYKQLTILRGLGLITDEEVHTLVSSESNLLAFHRAKARYLLEKLRAEIDRE